MGICLHNADYSMDMGYITFFHLRCAVAKQFGKNFLKTYKDWYTNNIPEGDMQRIVDNLFIKGILSTDKKDTLDFLFLPDNKGKVSYSGCKVLYKLVKDYDDNVQYGYTYSNNSFSYFKEMLRDCAKRRRTLFWS